MSTAMNTWLGVSLSPQEQLTPSQTDHHHSQNSVSHSLGFNSNELSGTVVSGDCFDLTSADSTLPPFGILEAFNRNKYHSQEWNMKGLGVNSENNYKTSSELSMLMATPRNNQEPKLENFLGGDSFSDHEQKLYSCATAGAGDYMFIPNCSLQLPSDDTTNSARTENNSSSNNHNSSIGVSMIKTRLRNQPDLAPSQPEAHNGNGASQSLLLSMSTGSQSGSPLTLFNGNGGVNGGESSSPSNNKQQKTMTGITTAATTVLNGQTGAIEAVPRKSIDTFGQRTSIYRGVTRHRWTGRYEAHLWDNSCRREGQTRKGRQVYLGGYDKEEKAARAYDLAALKYWGTTTTTNFPISNYEKELEEMKHMTRQEYVASLRRKSSGFSRGASIYRGVTRHHQHGRWQARIGRVAGNKDLYLGTFSTQEEAAEAYDIAAIKFRGLNAVTNFHMSRYDVNSILESSTLPIGGAAKRLKDAEQAAEMTVDGQRLSIIDDDNMSSQLTADGISYSPAAAVAAHQHGWPAIAAFQQAQHQTYSSLHFPYGQRIWCKQEQEDFHNQLQLGNYNTQNFFQPYVLHNLMNMESSSLEHSSSSNNSVIYNSNGSANQAGYVSSNNGGFVTPVGTVIAAIDSDQGFGESIDHQAAAAAKALGFENMYSSAASADPYHARNLYYLSQQQSSSNHPQGSACNNWVPTAIQTIAQRSSSMAVFRGAPTFTVGNDYIKP